MTHGSFADYRRGCRCPECILANRTYQREWARRKRDGTSTRIGAKPAQKHVAFLVAHGMRQRAIADLAGVSGSVVSNLARRETKKIERAASERILGVALGDLPDGNPKRWLPALAVIPLLDAMEASGMTAQDIIRVVGPKPCLLRRQKWIWRITYERAVVVCRMLAAQGLIPADALGEVGI